MMESEDDEEDAVLSSSTTSNSLIISLFSSSSSSSSSMNPLEETTTSNLSSPSLDVILSTSRLPILMMDESLAIEENPSETATNATQPFNVQIVVLAGIFIMIVVGNLPVVITIIFGKLGKTRMYYFLLHLCFADLITGCFNVIPQLAWELTRHFYGGNILCKTVKFLQILGPYLSSYTLTVMSIDRFLAICYPLTNNHLSLRRAKMSIVVAWALSLLFCVPQAIIFSYQVINDAGLMECWAIFPFQPWGERVYVTWYAVSVFIVPFIVIFFTHLKICCELWKSSKERRLTMKKGSRPLLEQRTCKGRLRTDEDDPDEEDRGRKSKISFPSFKSSKSNPRAKKKSATTETQVTLEYNHVESSPAKVSSDHQSTPPAGARLSKSCLKGSSLLSPPSHLAECSSPCPSSASTSKRNSVEFIQRMDGSSDVHVSGDDDLKRKEPSIGSRDRRSTTSSAVNRSTSQEEEHLRAKIKSVKLTVTVIVCYTICSLPFIVVQLWAYWYPGAQTSSYWTGPMVTIVMRLSSLNSCVNPWIYLTFNTKLYQALKRLFTCRPGHGDADSRSNDVRSC